MHTHAHWAYTFIYFGIGRSMLTPSNGLGRPQWCLRANATDEPEWCGWPSRDGALDPMLSTHTPENDVGLAPQCSRLPPNCPRFFTFVVRTGYYSKNQRREQRSFNLNKTLAGIALNVRSLAFSQPCFCIYIYSNVLDAEAAPGLLVADALQSLHPSVVAAGLPRLPRNIWGDPLVSWFALSYAKADVAALHLAKRERLIWIDVDTLITRSLQDAYLRLSSFVVLDSKTNKSYGDLWMLDDHVVAAVRAVYADLTVQLPYDLQSIFDILVDKEHNATGLHNLPRVLEPACWGFDFASNGHPYPINSSLYLKHLLGSKEFLGDGKIRLEAMGHGRLHCLPLGRADPVPVASMSFTMPSYLEMLRRPKALWYGPGVRQWFVTTYCGVRQVNRPTQLSWDPLASVCDEVQAL